MTQPASSPAPAPAPWRAAPARSHRPPWRVLAALLVVAALVIAGLIFWPQLQAFGRDALTQAQVAVQPPTPTPTEPAPPRTAPVSLVTVELAVEGAGSVSAVQAGAVAWKTSGTVAQVNVKAGDYVRAGQPLMTLDPLSVPQAVILAQGDVVTIQRALDDLMEPPTLTVAAAQHNLAKAADALSTAAKNLGYLTSPDMKFYTDQVQRAQDLVINAQQNASLVDIGQLQVDLRNAQKTLETATNVYNNAKDGFDDCPSCEKVWAYDRMTTWADAQNLYTDTVNRVQQIQTAIDQTQRGNALAITAAQDALDKAQRNLDWIRQGPEAVKLQLNQASVALAEASVADAQDKLNHLLYGPDPRDVAVLQSRLQAAQATIGWLTLTAPFNGEVLVVNNLPGDAVNTGQAALLLADRSVLRVDAQVDEADIRRITVGAPVSVTLDAVPGLTLPGAVTWINPNGAMLQGLVKYTVRVELAARDPRVLLGMTARVNIVVERQAQALAVPLGAVQRGPQGDFVQRMRAGVAETVPVSRGPRQGDQVVVTGDLQAGDLVLLPPGR